MIDEGTSAPAFELPAIIDGERRRVGLSEFLGEDVVILAFFPGAFNPGCDVESDLDQLDLFTMQPDVTVLAVGPDSVAANETFAAEYDLGIPLLADTERSVAAEYGVDYRDDLGQHLIARAVFVIDHDGDVAYAWSSTDPGALANVDEIKDALGDTGGDDTAFSRYRVGHAHYVEGRRAFTSAMDAYADSDWLLAQSDFTRAREAFQEAETQFTSAVRFVEDALASAHYEAATEKAASLWQAADWLGRSASEFSSGAGAAGDELREDAQGPLEAARTWPEPPDPDAWPPDGPPERREPADDRPAFQSEAGDPERAALDVDIDAEESGERAAPDQRTGADGQPARGLRAEASGRGGSDIGADELAEIEAEVAASGPDDPPERGPPPEDESVVEDPPATDDGGVADPAADLGSAGGGGSRSDGGDLESAESDGEAEPLAEADPASNSLEDIPSEADLEEDADEE